MRLILLAQVPLYVVSDPDLNSKLALAWEPQIGKVHGEPEPIGGSPTPADQRHVFGREVI